MARLGADVEQLDRLARTFETEATRLERSASTLRSLVSGVTWMGPDANQFRGQFNQSMSPQLAAIARALHDEARQLVQQATQQRRASSDGSGLGGGVGVGGGGGLGAGAGVGGGAGGGGGWSFGAGSSSFTGARAGNGEAFAGAEWRGEYTAGYGDLFSTRGWAEGQAGAGAEGSADFTVGPDGINAEAEGYAFAGARGEVGQHTDLFGGIVENESTLGGLVGAEAEGSGSFHLGLDGLEAGAEGRAFAGARAEYASETSLFGDFYRQTTGAYAEAGAGASGEANVDLGWGGVTAGAGGEAWAGARAGVEGETSLFGDNASVEAGAGVRAGVGVEGSAEVELGWERLGAEFDIGGALGIGADVSFGVEVSPSGLIQDGAGVVGDVADGARDLASSIPGVGGLFD
jgi:hypothetical protein